MRIIAGSMRSRTIVAPKGNDTRPTLDRTRESLFSIIAGNVPQAQVLDLYAGSGALVSHTVGAGKAYYYGTAFTESAARIFLTRLGVANPFGEALELPESCELAVRGDENSQYAFILNYLKTPAEITLKKPMKNLLTGETLGGTCILPPYGVLVLDV